MNQFEGFHPDQTHSIDIPAQFFFEILPNINDLHELKIILYAFWHNTKSEQEFPFLEKSNLMENDILLAGFGSSREEQIDNLLKGLKLAVEDKILIEAQLPSKIRKFTLYFINSPKGKKAIEAIKNEAFDFDPEADLTFQIIAPTKNIFTLYEENIGPLTPIIAEVLTEIENTYPYDWVQEAFQEALKNNVRKLRYIEAILINWQEAGKHDRTDRRRSQKTDEGYDPDRYIDGEYSEFIDH